MRFTCHLVKNLDLPQARHFYEELFPRPCVIYFFVVGQWQIYHIPTHAVVAKSLAKLRNGRCIFELPRSAPHIPRRDSDFECLGAWGKLHEQEH